MTNDAAPVDTADPRIAYFASLEYLHESIDVALAKNMKVDHIIEHLIEASAPIPEEKVREIVADRCAKAAADERNRIEEARRLFAEKAASEPAAEPDDPDDPDGRGGDGGDDPPGGGRTPGWAVPPDDPDPAGARRVDQQCRLYNMTDAGNADRLVRRYSHMTRYCHTLRLWFVWDGRRWLTDTSRIILLLARRATRSIYREADLEQDPARRGNLARWAVTSEGLPRIKGLIELSTADPDVMVAPTDLDKDPNLFNLQNGTLNLTTLELQEFKKTDLITKIGGVSHRTEAECPKWTDHVSMMFAGDADMIRGFQELCGYAMLNGNPLQIFPIFWGKGNNGKSVALTVLRTIFGDYGTSASPELFMESHREGGPRPDLVALRGIRFVTAAETREGQRLNASLVKQMTGGENIVARALYADQVEFPPSHLSILTTNNKPVIKEIGNAIWRRVQFWPFTYTIPEDKRVTDYEKILLDEGPGILNWMIEGLRRYQQNGNRIAVPAKTKLMTEAMKSEMDTIGQFFKEACIIGPEMEVGVADLYDTYATWCEKSGMTPKGKIKFGNELKDKGFRQRPTKAARLWIGIRIKTQVEIETGIESEPEEPETGGWW